MDLVQPLTFGSGLPYEPRNEFGAPFGASFTFQHRPEFNRLGPVRRTRKMKIKNSMKALKSRHRENRMVRRKGRIYIINKTNPRFKARQG